MLRNNSSNVQADITQRLESSHALSALSNGLTLEQINQLLDNATYTEKHALLTEKYLLTGEFWLAIPHAEKYLMDVDLSKATPLDKKVCKLLMHAYHRDTVIHGTKGRAHARNVLRFIDDNNYEANLLYAQMCLEEGKNQEAIDRAMKFLTLPRDEETRHFKYYDPVNLESKKEYPPQDWYYTRAMETIAMAYKNKGDIVNAKRYAEEAIQKYKELHHVPDIASRIMAWVCSQQGKYAEALAHLEKSWDLWNYPEYICIKIRALAATDKVYHAVHLGEEALYSQPHRHNREIASTLLSIYRMYPDRFSEKAKELTQNMNRWSLFTPTAQKSSEDKPHFRLRQ